MPPEINGPTSENPLKKIPKPVLVVGGAVGLVVLYTFYKNRSSANAANQTAANPYGPPEAGTGVLNPIVITQPGDNTTTTGTTPTSTNTTVPSALQQVGPITGVSPATLKGVNNEYYNYLIHHPAPGYTGIAWSKLSPAQRINIYEHTPVNGITGINWSKLTLAQQIGQYVHRPPSPKPASTPAPPTSKVA